jgi:hypothetical protein
MQPPASAWAEETILSDCLRDPACIDRCGDIGGELQFKEMRTIWQAMMRARMRGYNPKHWYSRVWAELEQALCKNFHTADWLRAHAADAADPWSAWWICKANAHLRLLNAGSALPGELDYALTLLHRCTEARQIVKQSVEVANRAWRVPERPLESDLPLPSLPARRRSGPPPPVWERTDAFRL